MARQRCVVLGLSSEPDGPGCVLWRVALRGAIALGEKDRHYVLYVRQRDGAPAPYADGTEVDLDERLLVPEAS